MSPSPKELRDQHFISLNEFIRMFCFPNNPKASITPLIGKIVPVIAERHAGTNTCYKAVAADQTHHVLISYIFLAEVFIHPELYFNIKIRGADIAEKNYNQLISMEFKNIEAACCCCPKKLKKILINSEAFSDFVRAGPVELRRFNQLKPSLQTIVCLDIEGNAFIESLAFF